MGPLTFVCCAALEPELESHALCPHATTCTAARFEEREREKKIIACSCYGSGRGLSGNAGVGFLR